MLPPELAGPIDDLMKSDLQLWRDNCFDWLLVSTLVVIIGVALEGPELVHGTISIIRRKFGRVDSAEQHHLPDWIALLGLFGWFLVVLGVAGEYVTDAMVSKADGNIQTFNDIMLTGARKDTALAFERAAHAEATARGFEAQIASSDARAKAAEAQVESAKAASRDAVARVAAADARSVEASAKAESFRRDIATANERAASANETAERERLARVQLEIKYAPRVLTPEQQDLLTKKLSPYKGTAVDVVLWEETAEVQRFGGTLILCLKNAGWVVGSETALGQGGVIGVLVGTRPGSDPKIAEAAGTLLATLSAFDIACAPWAFDKLPFPGVKVFGVAPSENSPIKLFIGAKPR
jgi:hypothetical protein